MKTLINKTIVFFIFYIFLNSCNESPSVDFHSYEELSGYHFLNDGWFPEILKTDATKIDETYDVCSKHLFGKFDFKQRALYDSIIHTYPAVKSDSLKIIINQIERPSCPEWFLKNEHIQENHYILAKHKGFYLLMDRKDNRIYFLR